MARARSPLAWKHRSEFQGRLATDERATPRGQSRLSEPWFYHLYSCHAVTCVTLPATQLGTETQSGEIALSLF